MGNNVKEDNMKEEMIKIEDKFGNQLRKLRLERNLSQEELSFRSGLSKNYISDVERGTRNISLEAIEKIASGLGVSVKTLFDWD